MLLSFIMSFLFESSILGLEILMGCSAVGAEVVGILARPETLCGKGLAGIDHLLCHQNYNYFSIISAQTAFSIQPCIFVFEEGIFFQSIRSIFQ